jgi:hypothetical protein
VSGQARWPDCASGWHDRCTEPGRCGCPCHTRAAAAPDQPVDSGEMRERREAALVDALTDDRMEQLLDSDVLTVATALLGWLGEDGWVLVRVRELLALVEDYRAVADAWDEEFDRGASAEAQRLIRALVVGE